MLFALLSALPALAIPPLAGVPTPAPVVDGPPATVIAHYKVELPVDGAIRSAVLEPVPAMAATGFLFSRCEAPDGVQAAFVLNPGPDRGPRKDVPTVMFMVDKMVDAPFSCRHYLMLQAGILAAVDVQVTPAVEGKPTNLLPILADEQALLRLCAPTGRTLAEAVIYPHEQPTLQATWRGRSYEVTVRDDRLGRPEYQLWQRGPDASPSPLTTMGGPRNTMPDATASASQMPDQPAVVVVEGPRARTMAEGRCAAFAAPAS
ncbi:hypothetical protein L6R53_32045 [Myxococcota bacterium]|nr:hypothetical protein [Myxococcota bacterium]